MPASEIATVLDDDERGCLFCPLRITLAQDELQVRCGWCGAHLRGPRDAPAARTSHGLCMACADGIRRAHALRRSVA